MDGRALAAPLAGVSTRAFRLLARESGAALVFTEMISSQGISRRQPRSWAMAGFKDDERPIGIQIFGADPGVMGQAARMLVQQNQPDVVDINFGCPVRKVISHNGGAAVLKDLVLTEEIIRATVEGAGGRPVTIKMRTGWNDTSDVFLEVGQIARKAGVAAVTLHGRSRSQGFSGTADWAAIKKLKESIDIPVIGNGDIVTPGDARRMLHETGCDFIMIGRAAIADPFIFKRINECLQTGMIPQPPSLSDRISLAGRHARLLAEEIGEQTAAIRMRRHLSWYVKGLHGAAQLRSELVRVNTLDDIDRILSDYLELTED